MDDLRRPPVPDLLRSFIDPDGRIISMPRREQKRIALLEWVADCLPRPLDVDEREMNALLAQLHDDVAMLRRYLVDHRLLERPEPGRYTTPDAAGQRFS